MSNWESLAYLIGEPLKFVLGTYEREQPDGEVKIYYGASDTVECLATANVNDLIDLCING